MPSLSVLHVSLCHVPAVYTLVHHKVLYKEAQRATLIKFSCHMFCSNTINSVGASFTATWVCIVAISVTSKKYLCSLCFVCCVDIN